MIKRIYNKIVSIIDKVIWKFHSYLESKRVLLPLTNSKYKHIENDIPINHQYPLNFSENDKKLFAHYTGYNSGTETIYQFNEVNVSYDGIVFKGLNNSSLSIPHVAFRADYGWLYMVKNYLIKKKTKTNDEKNYILIYDFWSAGNYYHWLVDSLPRLLIAQNELKDCNYSLLLPANCRAFIKNTLNYFQISSITYIESNEYLQVQSLLVPYYLAGSGHIHPTKVFEIKQFFVEKIKSSLNKKKVYVSRSRQKARLVVNEKQVIDEVTSLGFEVIYFEDYTFEQQVELSKGIKYLVSSHGANLTNLMFMNDGSRVLELIKSESPNFCYWALANVAKVDYYYQLCEVKGNDHLWVDIDLFKLTLQKFLNE